MLHTQVKQISPLPTTSTYWRGTYAEMGVTGWLGLQTIYGSTKYAVAYFRTRAVRKKDGLDGGSSFNDIWNAQWEARHYPIKLGKWTIKKGKGKFAEEPVKDPGFYTQGALKCLLYLSRGPLLVCALARHPSAFSHSSCSIAATESDLSLDTDSTVDFEAAMGEGQFAFDADEEVLSQADLLIEQAAVDLPALIRTTSEISDQAIISGDTSDSVLTASQVCMY